MPTVFHDRSHPWLAQRATLQSVGEPVSGLLPALAALTARFGRKHNPRPGGEEAVGDDYAASHLPGAEFGCAVKAAGEG